MAKITEITSPTRGIVGYLHEVECISPDSLLVFQLPRESAMLHGEYIRNATDALKKILPEGKNALVIGCDINIYELAGPDALVLKLKGLI
jgi:hypothetical protein